MLFAENMLEEQVAIVTGGGTGIGLGISRALAGAGANVAIASRKPEHLDAALDHLADLPGSVRAVPTNVREPDAARAMVEATLDAFGRVDILVNNAAGNFYAPSATLRPNAWKAVIETDLYGTFYCSQAVYPAMKQQGGGRIISTSMTLHYRGWPMMAHATAAKAGVDALTRTLALEWAADGIRVNAVAPGPVPTEGVKQAFTKPGSDKPDIDAMNRELIRSVPLGRLGDPSDIGNMVAFLAGPGGEWITGAIMVVDGGSWLTRM